MCVTSKTSRRLCIAIFLQLQVDATPLQRVSFAVCVAALCSAPSGPTEHTSLSSDILINLSADPKECQVVCHRQQRLARGIQISTLAVFKMLRVACTTLILLLVVCTANGQDCPVEYSSQGPSLLFGGVSSRCLSGCQSRKAVQPNDWGNVCTFNPNGTVWGVCTAQQAQRSLELAKKLGGGSILQLSPCDLVPYLRGRTLWLLGDSHSKTLYRALQCFLYDFWGQSECKISTDPKDVQDFNKQPAADGVSNCFHLTGAGGGRVCIIHVALTSSLVNSTEVAGGGILPLLRQRLASPHDIFYVNTGTWHRKTPQWASEYQPDLVALGEYYAATKASWPHLLFRETPAIHPADTARNVCLPLDGYEYDANSGTLSLQSSVQDSAAMWASSYGLNKVVRETLPKYGLYVVPGYNMTAPLVDNHVAMRNSPALDCLHYCQPGQPETWVWYLYNAMREGRAGIQPLALTSSDVDVPMPKPSSSSGSSLSSPNSHKARSSSSAKSAAPARQLKKAPARQLKEAPAQTVVGKWQYACTPSTIRL
eukprot:GHRQ01014091.1.p1 GENE.GHRQ01014091.1~~GHRQ01014091.1.p1  ORF type:complete len:538 (+),score=152.89 GHRQ01014091.1:624-2237(+)